MNRTDLQRLAEERIAEAKILLDAGKWAGAYYLAGYAVECALKACIAKMTKAEDFPDLKLATRSWSHDLGGLLATAGLAADWQSFCQPGTEAWFEWQTTKDWKESSRYESGNEAGARALYEAITDPVHGVLPWIKLRW